MIGDLSEDDSVIVYNRTFEEWLVNKRLAEMYHGLKDEIERIDGNFVDLRVPFRNMDYWVREIKWSCSINKCLTAIFWMTLVLTIPIFRWFIWGRKRHTYSWTWRKCLLKRDGTRNAMLKYCELDTWAMVEIWEKFKEAAGVK